MTLNPNISFSGQCEAAFRFYKRCLGAKIVTILTWGNSPMAAEVPPEWHTKICHATLTVGANVLTGGDPPLHQYEQPKGFEMLLGIENPADAERIFEALVENGTVQMPMQKTFWATRFGALADQFGIAWSINCGQPD